MSREVQKQWMTKRLVRAVLPLDKERCVHVVVVYGYEWELVMIRRRLPRLITAVAGGHPKLIIGYFIPCLLKVIHKLQVRARASLAIMALYRCSSTAPFVDLQKRFKNVLVYSG